MNAPDERQYIVYECRDRIATIALNRPEKSNAVGDEVVRQMMAAFRRFDADSDAYVAILCGRGRAFCSGADVHQRRLRSREEFERLAVYKDLVPVPAICDFSRSIGSRLSPRCTAMYWVLAWALSLTAI